MRKMLILYLLYPSCSNGVNIQKACRENHFNGFDKASIKSENFTVSTTLFFFYKINNKIEFKQKRIALTLDRTV